jgi:hypothetical protein
MIGSTFSVLRVALTSPLKRIVRPKRPSFTVTLGLVKLAPLAMSGPAICVNCQSTEVGEERCTRKVTLLAVGELVSRIELRRPSGSYQLVESEYATLPSTSRPPRL